MKRIFILVTILSLGLLLASCSNKPVYAENGPFTVTFDSLGGSEVVELEVEKQTFFLPSSIPTKDGFIFGGWYLDANYYYPMAFSAGVTSNIVLYAKWISPSELSGEDIASIVSAILTERGYDLTMSELITSLEELIVPSLLSDDDVKQVVADAIRDINLSLSPEDLSTLVDYLMDNEALMSTILSNIQVAEMFENHITSLLNDVSQSVVMIDTYDGSELVSGGSGVIYKRDGNNYYVLTNEHVVYDYEYGNYYSNNEFAITIFHENGDKYIARSSSNIRLLGKSVAHDLAIIRFTSTENFRVIDMGSYDSLKVGQIVFAIGSPLDLPNTSSMGIISQFDREQYDDYGMDTITIQHTAPINPGNSGGALINLNGELIGINNMSYVDMEIGEGIEGLHFAIQINILMQMIPILEND